MFCPPSSVQQLFPETEPFVEGHLGYVSHIKRIHDFISVGFARTFSDRPPYP